MKPLPILMAVMLAALAPLRSEALEEPGGKEPAPGSVKVEFADATDLQDVLTLYATLTRRHVWVELGVSTKIALRWEKPIPKEEAVELIRTTLLEKHGIALRETEGKETFVSWSDDPKYIEVRRKVAAEAQAKAEKAGAEKPGATPGERRRIRIIDKSQAPSPPAEAPK